tara:strand:- start:483 stop:1262 length:780 start_codon:yes stop_codon:yes gene_type:complete
MPPQYSAVLSGGGFDGFWAILGAAQELNRRHNIHQWAGTSAGSIVAAIMACEVPIESIIRQATGSDLAPRDISFADTSVLSNAELLGMFRRHFPAKLGDVRRRLKVCTTNLTTARAMVWDSCDHGWAPLPELILASTAIPFAFPAVKIGRYHHCDGGVTHNLLADAFPLSPTIAVTAFQRSFQARPSGVFARAKWTASRCVSAALASNIREDLEDAADLRSVITVPRRPDSGLKTFWRINEAMDAMEAGAKALESVGKK